MIPLGDDYRSVTAFARTQIEEFWPTRLDDWDNGRIQLKVKVASVSHVIEEFDQRKKETSITDPACCLIMGFDEAVLYLTPLLMDPLEHACMGDGSCKRR